MARIDLSDSTLTVHVTGIDVLLALKSELAVPLAHVTGAKVDREVAREWWKGLKMPGSNIPGVVTAGTFYQQGERIFWDVHDPDQTIVISLAHDRYSALVVQ